MKKSTMLAFTAALLMSAASITGHAASAPTYDDNLILPNPASAPGLSNVVLVPVASPQVVQSLHDYVKAWENAEQKIALAKAKRDNHEQLTKADKNGCIPKINITMLITSVRTPLVAYMALKQL